MMCPGVLSINGPAAATTGSTVTFTSNVDYLASPNMPAFNWKLNGYPFSNTGSATQSSSSVVGGHIVVCCHVTICHILSHSFKSCHIPSHPVTSRHILSQSYTSRHSLSHPVTVCHILSQSATSCHSMSYPVYQTLKVSYYLVFTIHPILCFITFNNKLFDIINNNHVSQSTYEFSIASIAATHAGTYSVTATYANLGTSGSLEINTKVLGKKLIKLWLNEFSS